MSSIWAEKPELTEALRELAADGLSMSQIARVLGNGLSRNAVIGRLSRLNIPHKSAAMSKLPRPFNLPSVNGLGGPKQAKKPPKVFAPDASAPTPAVDESGAPITMINVEKVHCRYVYGEPGEKTFHFCGLPKFSGSFCEFHARKCHQPIHPARGTEAA